MKTNQKAVFSVVNDKGLVFNVAIVRKGDRYGFNDRLVHEDEQGLGPMVELYDARYTEGFTPIGQFVSGYYVETLLEGDDARECFGLDMCGHVNDWKLDKVAYTMLRRFLRTLK